MHYAHVVVNWYALFLCIISIVVCSINTPLSGILPDVAHFDPVDRSTPPVRKILSKPWLPLMTWKKWVINRHPPNTARLLDGTDQRSEVFFGWGGWKTCFKRWNMWGWRWIFRNAYMYMHTYDICSLCTTTFVFAFFCEGIVSNKWFVILRVGYLEAILWCYSAYLGWYGNHSKMEKHQFSYEDRLLT